MIFRPVVCYGVKLLAPTRAGPAAVAHEPCTVRLHARQPAGQGLQDLSWSKRSAPTSVRLSAQFDRLVGRSGVARPKEQVPDLSCSTSATGSSSWCLARLTAMVDCGSPCPWRWCRLQRGRAPGLRRRARRYATVTRPRSLASRRRAISPAVLQKSWLSRQAAKSLGCGAQVQS